MDITPYIAIIGAILGAVVAGAIGLFGHRMNLKHQRRKELREHVVDFLRASDRLHDIASEINVAGGAAKKLLGGSAASETLRKELLDALEESRHYSQHLELLAPEKLRRSTQTMDAALTDIVGCALFSTETVDNRDSRNSAISAANGTFHDARHHVIRYLRPDLYRERMLVRLVPMRFRRRNMP